MPGPRNPEPHGPPAHSTQPITHTQSADQLAEQIKPANGTPHTRPKAKHWLALSLLLLCTLAVVLPPLINVNRYHRLIAESISAAVGRPVHMADVKLVMLPRPGFELTDFVVEEDPAFGAEPVLRSATVRASIRLISLWRGRLEIARIQLEEPSLNLVRNPAGQWNVAGIFTQAARIPNAPTGQRHSGETLRFPYIEAANARINFKLGDEKKPFSFLDADLSLWLAQPDEWQLRFDAQPVRTDLDLNLADTGLVRVKGSLHRAPSLSLMPLDLTVDWSGASLGQLSRLLTGEDPGWRGTIDLRGTIAGTAEDALINTQVRGSGIHRAEFEPDSTLEPAANCELHYHYALQSIDSLICLAPVDAGQVLLRGSVDKLTQSPHPVLSLEMDDVPVAAIFRGMQTLRRTFPQGIRAMGKVNGRFTYDTALTQPFDGQASIDKLILAADGLKQPLIFNRLTASAEGVPSVARVPQAQRTSRSSVSRHASTGIAGSTLQTPSLRISPLVLAVPGDPPLQLDCLLSAIGFAVHAAGSAPMRRIVTLNEAFHILPITSGSLAPQGQADLDLTVHGPWLLPIGPQSAIENRPATPPDHPTPEAIAAPGIEGTLHLRNTQLTTSFLATPLDITSASATFSGTSVNWLPIAINYGPLHAEGSLSARIPCPPEADCGRHFELHINSLDIATLQSTLLGARRDELVEEIITRITERPRPWPRMEGNLRIDTLTLNDRAPTPLVFHDVSARIVAEGNVMTLQSLTAKTLGGNLEAKGTIDAGGDVPAYTLQLELANADAAQTSGLFQERWGSGTIKLSTHLQLSGYTVTQLTNSAAGTFHAEWNNHAPPSLSAGPTAIVNFSRFETWIADGTISNNRLLLDHSFINPPAMKAQARATRRSPSGAGANPAAIPITGTVNFNRQLSLREDQDSLEITGTLQQPLTSTAIPAPQPQLPGSGPARSHPANH
ncbi:MAG TPA: AsmA family protein [Acidisarcina sp.]